MACQKAKFTKLRRCGRKPERPLSPGSNMVTDMQGPVRQGEWNDERYYQGFQDEYTKLLVHRCFKLRSQAYLNLRYTLQEDIFDSVKIYKSDGALEL